MRKAAPLICALAFGCVSAVGFDPPDAGPDGGVAPDAGAHDAGATHDAGVPDAGSQDAGAPDAGAPDAGTPDAGPLDTTPSILGRTYHLHVPPGYVPGRALPLLVMFHGYGSSAVGHEAYLHFIDLANEKGFLYAYPDGLTDILGNQFWNGTDACCDIYDKPTDDVYFAETLIDDVRTNYTVDPKRIFLFGHSNGGFMAHRLACDLAPTLAGVVSLAGMTWKDPSKCAAKDRVAVLQIHGDADTTIYYNGGRLAAPWMAPYPSAHDTVATWAAIDGCGALQATGETRDIVPNLQTTVERYANCAGDGVELWTVHGGQHVPDLTPNWYEPVWSFLAAHPKP